MNIDKFKVNTNNNGNGLIILQTKEKKTYSYELNNFKLPINLENIKQLNENNIEELYSSQKNNSIEIKKLSYNFPEGYLFSVPTKLDSSGNGYITWLNNVQNLIIKLVTNYEIYDKELVVSSTVRNQYAIDLDSYGYGILVWNDNENLYAETINGYVSIKTEKLNLSNKGSFSNINVTLNQKRNGIITWIDSLNNLYMKKIVI